MPFVRFEKFNQSPFSVLRNSTTPSLVVYDVLGHLPQPRTVIPKDLARNFNLRSKNGFLFSKKGDVVLTSEELDPDHKKWLQESGLAEGMVFLSRYNEATPFISFAENFINFPENIKSLNDAVITHHITSLFSWMNTTTELRLAQDLHLTTTWSHDLDLLQDQFNKITFKKFLTTLELPLIASQTFQPLTAASFEENMMALKNHLQKIGDPLEVIAKPIDSAAGCSVMRFDSTNILTTLKTILKQGDTPWLIEPYISHTHSINIQTFINTDTLHLLGTSEQILDGFSYQGNTWDHSLVSMDSYKNALRQTFIISKKLQSLNYVGLIGLDFLLLEDGSSYCLENNIRINGSTFALTLVAELEYRGFSNLSWTFKKYNLPGIIPFDEIAATLGSSLFSVKSFAGQGLFLQEFHHFEGTTILAVVFIAMDPQDLKKIESDFIHKMESFYGRP